MSVLELHPEYLADLARQFGFLGAFLGGVSATFFVTLLTLAKPSLVVRWSIGLSAVAAAAFIMTAYMSVGVIAKNHPQAPQIVIENSNAPVQLGMAISFAIGTFSLLAAIGTSGWSRSKPLGYVTTTVAILAAIPLLLDLA